MRPELQSRRTVAPKDRYVTGLDVGASTITALVGKKNAAGKMDIIGVGVADSSGIKRGKVVDTDAAVEAIKNAIEKARKDAGVIIKTVHLGVPVKNSPSTAGIITCVTRAGVTVADTVLEQM